MDSAAWQRAAEAYAYRLGTRTECRMVLTELRRQAVKSEAGPGDPRVILAAVQRRLAELRSADR